MIGTLLQQHSTNVVDVTNSTSGSRKAWAQSYPPIPQLTVHTHIQQDGSILADFDAVFGQEQPDDTRRLQELAYPPDDRQWRLETESDMSNWFHHEVSNVVLAAFKRHPTVIQQSEAKVASMTYVAQVVDDVYATVESGSYLRAPLVIGEFKRNLIAPNSWREGKLDDPSQLALSQELRGQGDLSPKKT